MNEKPIFHQFFSKNHDEIDNTASNTSKTDTIGDLIVKRYSRRTFVRGSLAVSIGAGLASVWACSDQTEPEAIDSLQGTSGSESTKKANFDFTEITHGQGPDHMVAPDHRAEVLIRWGDPIFADAPEFDPHVPSADAQEQQFGFNNDFIGYWLLESVDGEDQRALLCVNHEYPSSKMMFPGIKGNFQQTVTVEQIEYEKAAVGCSVIEIEKQGANWQLNRNSRYNRRISARSTEIELTGPAAGHERMRTTADPSGTRVIGTMNNCAGGMTPWGTYLSCEENINSHFLGTLEPGHREAKNHQRFGIPASYYQWGRFDPRFDIGREPNEPNRFGWVVEIDPLDPQSMPKKRTALGRFKHEGAENVIAPDGRLVIYMGDDQRFDYLYKFVSHDKVNLEDAAANRDLLDHGTLYAARFSDDGSIQWLAIEHGNGPLTSDNGFESQADVLIETRRAADLLGATPMDRPEDVVPNQKTGKVYVMLTNNTQRKADALNAANPRGPNTYGHIIEITEPGQDFAADQSSWDFLIKAGDPSKPELGAHWHSDTSRNGWFASPDNGVIDPGGRLWVSTDQGDKISLSGTNDGLWAMETQGESRGKGKMFFRCPDGAELCGPAFSNDGESLFVAVQHPGDDDSPAVNFDNPTTRWPDFKPDRPPRPSVMFISRKEKGRVG